MAEDGGNKDERKLPKNNTDRVKGTDCINPGAENRHTATRPALRGVKERAITNQE